VPEGHTLHRLAAEYNARFRGRPTHSCSPQGRFAPEATRIDGQVLVNAEAHGKHLFAEFGENVVHVHLGLLGKVTFTPATRSSAGGKGLGSGGAIRQPEPEIDLVPAAVGALRWRLTTVDAAAGNQMYPVDAAADDQMYRANTADLRGPTACEILTPGEVDIVMGRLGPDPLRLDADPDIGWQRVSKSRMPIAALLMDQRVAAGVGNIYRAELLYRHRLDPMMEGRLLRAAEWQAMWGDLVTLMRLGVLTGRIDTVRPEHEPEAMGRQPRMDRHGGEVYVYRRSGQPCLVCGIPIRMAELAGRNLFWCPGCQRRSRRRSPISRQ
jgi:endonuclease-8